MRPDTGNYRSRQSDDDYLDFRRVVDIGLAHKWTVIGTVAAAILLALFLLFVSVPIYRTYSLIQITTGGSSVLQSMLDVQSAYLLYPSPDVAPEMEIITSRSVLGDVVDDMNLRIRANAVYPPVVGRAIAEARGGLAGIEVARFEVPPALAGRSFVLTALDKGRYTLADTEGQVLLRGQVGEQASAQVEGGRIQLFVRSLLPPQTPFEYALRKQGRLVAVKRLQGKIKVMQRGPGSGILEISMQGADRQQITHIVNHVTTAYVRQNVEARTKEAQQTLEFLQEQLPEIRSKLNQAERKLSRFLEEQQAVNLTAEGQALLQQIVALEQKILQTQLERDALLERFTPQHPQIQIVSEQLAQLRAKRAQLEGQVGDLPDLQRKILGLQRAVEVYTGLYTSMLDRAQTLKVVKAGTVGNVRVIDPAVAPLGPISPNPKLMLMVAIILGFLIGAVLVAAKVFFRRVLYNPSDIEAKTGLPVYATVPFSPWQYRHGEDNRGKNKNGIPLIALSRPEDTATEAIRSLRTSLYFAQMDTGKNIMLFTGPAPGLGKTFISANLAVLLAEAGKKIIVIDADMRRGRLHRYMNQRRAGGLSELLSGQLTLAAAKKRVDLEGGLAFDVITSGGIPPNPSELLMQPRLDEALSQLRNEYDAVLIDSPPLLAVTDSAILAGHDTITFLIVRGGETRLPEIELCADRLSQHNTRIAGVIFNGLRESDARAYGGSYYGQYGYEYKARSAK